MIANASDYFSYKASSDDKTFKMLSQNLASTVRKAKLTSFHGERVWLKVDSQKGLIRVATEIDRDEICQKSEICKILATVSLIGKPF